MRTIKNRSITVSLLIFAIFSHSARAADFFEDQVAKHISIKRTLPKSVLINPSPGQVWADLYFEFLILKDSSLWVRPLFGTQEERVKFGGIPIDRSQPQEIKLSGFVAQKFFTLNKHVYLVVKQKEPRFTEKRYLIELSPKIGKPPTLTGALLDSEVFLPSAAGTYLLDYVEPTLIGAFSAFLSTGLYVSAGMRLYNNVCDQLKGCKASVGEDLGIIKNDEGYPISVKRYVFNSDHSVADVILSDSQGKNYFLSKLGSVSSCKLRSENSPA